MHCHHESVLFIFKFPAPPWRMLLSISFIPFPLEKCTLPVFLLYDWKRKRKLFSDLSIFFTDLLNNFYLMGQSAFSIPSICRFPLTYSGLTPYVLWHCILIEIIRAERILISMQELFINIPWLLVKANLFLLCF